MTFLKIKKLALLVVITVVFSIPFYQALSTSVPGTIAIQLGEDESINSATRTLQNNLPGISIIKYNSFKYHLISHRVVQPIIWIGHGTQEGIIANNELMKWTQFSEKIKQSRSLDIILSCYSSEIIQQTTLTRNDVITFNNDIDSVLGSLFIAYALTGSQSILSQAGNHYLSLLNKETPYRLLRIVGGGGGGGGGNNPPTTPNIPSSFQVAESSHSYVIFHLSGIELAFWVIMLVVLALNIIIGIPISHTDWSFITKAAAMFFAVGQYTLITALALYAGGMMTEEALIENIFRSFLEILGCIALTFSALAAGEKILFVLILALAGVIFTVEILLDIFGGGSGTIVRTLSTIAMIAVYLIGFMFDASDTDTVVG